MRRATVGSHRRCTNGVLVGATGYFHEMPTKLGFDGPLDRANLATENHPIEFGNHLTGPEFARPPPCLPEGH